MKRKGFLLLEALISLFILTSLALSIFPLATETARVIDSLASADGFRARCSRFPTT